MPPDSLPKLHIPPLATPSPSVPLSPATFTLTHVQQQVNHPLSFHLFQPLRTPNPNPLSALSLNPLSFQSITLDLDLMPSLTSNHLAPSPSLHPTSTSSFILNPFSSSLPL